MAESVKFNWIPHSTFHMFSVGFKSGLCEDYSKTSILAPLSHSLTTFDVCLGSLFCYQRASLLLIILGFPEKKKPQKNQPHNIILPAPCLTVGMVLRVKGLTFSSPNWLLLIVAKQLSLFIWPQSFPPEDLSLSMWSTANFSRALTCLVWSKGFFLAWQPLSSCWWKTAPDCGHRHLSSSSF